MAAVREEALRMLMRMAGTAPYSPPACTEQDAIISRLIAAGASETDIRNALGCSPDELIASLYRLAN